MRWLLFAAFFPLSACLGEPAACPPVADETPRLGADGCATAGLVDGECYEDADCRDSVCFDISCRRDPGCLDSDAATECPVDCEGGCADPNVVGYCESDVECDADFRCRTDDRFCVRDRRDPVGNCVGWCVPVCFDTTGFAVFEPGTDKCFVFGDSCPPPGFSLGASTAQCTPF
jgi:hypothetical protein